MVLNVIRLSGNKETRDILANTWLGVLISPVFKKIFKIDSESTAASTPRTSTFNRSSNPILTNTTKGKANTSSSSSEISKTNSVKMKRQCEVVVESLTD